MKILNFKFQMRGVSRNEFSFVLMVLALVGALAFLNFQRAYVRARDIQRKNDLKHIATALANYQYDFGQYPPSRDGKILACGAPEAFRVCEWGADGLKDVSDLDYPPYISTFPNDPHQSAGKARYIYISNTQNFQLFASLENKQDAEYNDRVSSLRLDCGGRICNFKVASNEKIEGLLDERQAIESVLPNGKKK